MTTSNPEPSYSPTLTRGMSRKHLCLPLVWSRTAGSNILLALGIVYFAHQVQAQSPPPPTDIIYWAEGRLNYLRDVEGNRIPDFSHAGYKQGASPFPNATVKETIGPIEGDNTVHIRFHINKVGALPPDPVTGLRGAVLLTPGVYEISDPILVNHDGVVLRGSGDGADPNSNTIIKAIETDDSMVAPVVLGKSTNWRSWRSDMIWETRSNITSQAVLIGERFFDIEDPSWYNPGDHIVIIHPCTQNWLNYIEADFWTCHGGEEPRIMYKRKILSISGDTLEIDAPLFHHLRRQIPDPDNPEDNIIASQAYVCKYNQDNSELISNVGIENLRIDIQFDDTKVDRGIYVDENHAKNALFLRGVENAWVDRVTMLHFWQSGIDTMMANQVMISNSKAIEPVSTDSGGRRYNFSVGGSTQHILFFNNYSKDARHSYISNGGSTTSGIVFLDNISDSPSLASESHQGWGQGILFDRHQEINERGFSWTGAIRLRMGLSYSPEDGDPGRYSVDPDDPNKVINPHGWATVHSVAWNIDMPASNIFLHKPPTAQNYVIGGNYDKIFCSWPGDIADTTDDDIGECHGIENGIDHRVIRSLGNLPSSLYAQQLWERLFG